MCTGSSSNPKNCSGTRQRTKAIKFWTWPHLHRYESDQSYRAQPATVLRWVRAVKWSPDEADKLLVDVWCVSVDFTVDFSHLWGSEYICFFNARLRTWQRTTSLRCCLAADVRVCSWWENFKAFYGTERWWWMCTALWGNIVKIPLYAFVSRVFSWTLV